MLIGLKCDFLYVTVTFRAIGSVGETVRSVELSYDEARDLMRALAKVVKQDPEDLYDEQARWELD